MKTHHDMPGGGSLKVTQVLSLA